MERSVARPCPLPSTYTARVLAALRRRYGRLLPGCAHLFSVSLPARTWLLAAGGWADAKIDSVRNWSLGLLLLAILGLLANLLIPGA